MKKFTALALVAGLSAVGAQAQTNQLVYNAETGNLSIVNNEGVANYVIEIVGSGLSFNSANHARFLGGTGASTETTISESNPFAPQSGDHNLGDVLPVGLSQAQFALNADGGVLSKADYVKGFGAPITDFELVYVPEPTSLALLGLGGLLVARRRRG